MNNQDEQPLEHIDSSSKPPKEISQFEKSIPTHRAYIKGNI